MRSISEARSHLKDLVAYMDGKTGAEDLVSKALQDSNLIQAVGSSALPQEPKAPAADELAPPETPPEGQE